MKIQLDIKKELNKKLKVYKAENEKPSIQVSIIEILNKYFGRKKK
jgi:hypothetical protein